MNKKAQKIKVTIDNPLLARALEVAAGAVVDVEVNGNGVPLSRFWRNRFKEAKKPGRKSISYKGLVKDKEKPRKAAAAKKGESK